MIPGAAHGAGWSKGGHFQRAIDNASNSCAPPSAFYSSWPKLKSVGRMRFTPFRPVPGGVVQPCPNRRVRLLKTMSSKYTNHRSMTTMLESAQTLPAPFRDLPAPRRMETQSQSVDGMAATKTCAPWMPLFDMYMTVSTSDCLLTPL